MSQFLFLITEPKIFVSFKLSLLIDPEKLKDIKDAEFCSYPDMFILKTQVVLGEIIKILFCEGKSPSTVSSLVELSVVSNLS